MTTAYEELLKEKQELVEERQEVDEEIAQCPTSLSRIMGSGRTHLIKKGEIRCSNSLKVGTPLALIRSGEKKPK